MTTLHITIYHPPNGRTSEHDIPSVYPDDAAWFTQNGVKVSMEEVGDQFATYGDVGLKDADGEPDEVLVLSKGRKCKDTLRELREACEKALKEKP